MANILFKKGSYEDFKTKVLDANNVEDGALYLTDNEGGLYLGKSDGTVQRIQGSVLYYNSLIEFTNKIAPPYSSDVIYFIADRNAFVRWNGSEWVVINKTANEVITQLTDLGERITREEDRAQGVENELKGKNDEQDVAINGKLNINGTNSMTNDLNVGNHKIVNVANGTADADAANIGQVNSKVKVVNDALNNTKENVSNIKTRVDNIETGLSDTGINITNKTITLQNDLDANNKSIIGLAPLGDTPANDAAATVEYVKRSIQANDAMTFKGTVGLEATVSNLPTEAVQCGDTYKVATQGTYAGITAKVGDLFINKAADNTNPSWEHISSGYEDDYLQKFDISPDEGNNQVTIYLTDGVNNNATNSPSNFVIQGTTTSNLKFTASGSTITATMTWGEF